MLEGSLSCFAFTNSCSEFRDAGGLVFTECSLVYRMVKIVAIPFTSIDEGFAFPSFRTIWCTEGVGFGRFLGPGGLIFAWIPPRRSLPKLESISYVPMFWIVFDKVVPQVANIEVFFFFLFGFVVRDQDNMRLTLSFASSLVFAASLVGAAACSLPCLGHNSSRFDDVTWFFFSFG